MPHSLMVSLAVPWGLVSNPCARSFELPKTNRKTKSVHSVHDRSRQMMRPVGRVVMGPEPCINLRDDNLLSGRTDFVDLIGQQSGGVEAVCSDLNFFPAVPRNHLVGV